MGVGYYHQTIRTESREGAIDASSKKIDPIVGCRRKPVEEGSY